MDIQKIEPKRALKTLRDEIDTLFDRFVERPLGVITGQVIPPMDISETDTEIVVKTDLPGMAQEDIDISIAGDILTVKGQKKQETEDAGKTFHTVERSYGSFSRSVRLPAAVIADQVEASYKQGVLKIVLPKKEPLQAKKIEIKEE